MAKGVVSGSTHSWWTELVAPLLNWTGFRLLAELRLKTISLYRLMVGSFRHGSLL